MISSVIESCVNCKKLRGATLTKHMANLLDLYNVDEGKDFQSFGEECGEFIHSVTPIVFFFV